MVWSPDKHSTHMEAEKVAHLLVPYTRGTGVDVGSGHNRVFPHFTTIDSGKDFGGEKVADIHAPGETLPFGDKTLDFVFSSHFLEHVVDYRAALTDWWRTIKVGGHLVLYLPHKLLYPNIGQPGANPDHKHDFMPADILVAMAGAAKAVGAGWDLVENEERGLNDEYSFFQVYRKRADEQRRDVPWQRQPGGKKRALVIRYGAFGDQIQASSILPLLKEQGYHVTYNTAPRGHQIIQHDPHIDEFLIQDENQVPNGMLGMYWERLQERYDRIVNLSGSVEDGLLAHHERSMSFHYPHEVRHKLLNVNYMERTHDIAGVPHRFNPQFYPTDEEKDRAATVVAGDVPVILWVMSGSSVHKSWPYVDIAIHELLKHSNARIITVGDKGCQPLEEQVACRALGAFAMEPEQAHKLAQMKVDELAPLVDAKYGAGRLMMTSGLWSIRFTMAVAQRCHAVVGPETGVLNAVAMLPEVGKVLMLSHSSEENLSKHWANTISLAPKVACHPCHRMHYSFRYCPQDEKTGGSVCAAAIKTGDVLRAIDGVLSHLKKAA